MKNQIKLSVLFLLLNSLSFGQKILKIEPNSAELGQKLQVTISGLNTGFQQGTDLIQITNGITIISPDPVSVIVPSDSSVLATFTFSSDYTAGAYDVKILNARSQFVYQMLQNGFTLLPASVKPSLISFNPQKGTQETEVAITIQGIHTHFTKSNTNVELVLSSKIYPKKITIDNDTMLTAVFNFKICQSPGKYNMVVSNALDGTMRIDSSFTLEPTAKIPSIVSVTPKTATIGEQLSLTITGDNVTFQQGTDVVVLDNGNNIIEPTSYSYFSNNTIIAVFNLLQNYIPGQYDVTINRYQNCSLTLPHGLTIYPDSTPAIISSVTPSTGKQGETILLTIKGNNTHFLSNTNSIILRNDRTVIFPKKIKVVDDVTVQVECSFLYSHPVGLYSVFISNNVEGTVILSKSFELSAGPNIPYISSVTPSTSPLGKTLTLTISGVNLNFQQGTDVVSLSNDSKVIEPIGITFINPDQLNATFIIDTDIKTIGFYDVNVGNTKLNKGFLVYKEVTEIPGDSSFSLNPQNDSTVIKFSKDAFKNISFIGNNITYRLVLSNGDLLPSWMYFDPITLTLTVYLHKIKGDVSIDVVLLATDETGKTAAYNYNNIVLGVQSVTYDSPINIYPNPTVDHITINGIEQNSVSLFVYNMSGVLVKYEKLSVGKNDVDVSTLSQGIYILRIKSSTQEYQQKLIKE